jgi:hypothetical protein
MKLLPAVLVALVLVGCSSAAKAPAPIKNTPAIPPVAPDRQETRLVDGALWTCQIGDYDPQPCKLTAVGDIWVLTKLLGSQRFKGRLLLLDEDNARFIGNYYCPWGDCDAPMDVELKRDAAAFVGNFSNDTISIRYDRTMAAEWGGAGYGRFTGDEK